MSEATPSPEHKPLDPSNPWVTVALPPLAEAFTPPTPEEPHDRSEFKEAVVEQAELSVSFNTRLAHLELPERLEPLRERFLRLPELVFQPGVNLIFGPNGGGKSTLLRAIYYAIRAENRYRHNRQRGTSEEEARRLADSTFELPRSRGSDYEEYLMSGAGPLFGSAIDMRALATNAGPLYFDGQELVGRQRASLQEMARMQGMNHHGGSFIELSGNQYGDEDIVDSASRSLSARQTVDENLYYFLDTVFSNGGWGREKAPTSNWEMPPDLAKFARKRFAKSDRLLGFSERKVQYYKGIIACMDEPETGMDPARHLKLPDDITNWHPEGAILPIATNSTELYRAYKEGKFPAIDLSDPEKGLHTVD